MKSNLDLNTTARKQLKKLIHLTSYLDLGSYLVTTFDVAEPIAEFKLPEKPKEEEETVDDPKGKKGSKAKPKP